MSKSLSTLQSPVHLTLSLLSMVLLALAAGLFYVSKAPASDDNVANTPPIAAVDDPVARLQKRLDAHQAQLAYDEKFGYLTSLLDSLKIPKTSQGLVFSKTSFQRSIISPRNPRALYFNDDSYVGYVPGGPLLEIAAIDPKLGSVFYVLKQRESSRPQFIRQTYQCLQCHQSGMTQDVPGLIMRSVYPDFEGEPILTAGTFSSNDQSPLKKRWGGWYVTGTCGGQTHMGNAICTDEEHADRTDFAPTSNVIALDDRVNASAYLQNSSDMAALMVVAHQTHLHNLMTAASIGVQEALRDSDAINRSLKQPASTRSESTTRRIHNACEPVVRAMFFCNEAKLTAAIAGSTKFADEFSAVGPRDAQGRSLRELDLTHRMFKYPCSYLIYSEQFDNLPEEARSYIYRRMWQVLTGREDDPAFDHLSDADRESILQILRKTKKDLPKYWKAAQ